MTTLKNKLPRIELHVIQTLPPGRYNSGESGEQKTARFGGTRRTRISSQSWGRAMRERLRELSHPTAEQTRHLVGWINQHLRERGIMESGLARLVVGAIIATETTTRQGRIIYKTNTNLTLMPSEALALVDLIEANQEALSKLLEQDVSSRGKSRTELEAQIHEAEAKYGEKPPRGSEGAKVLGKLRRALEEIQAEAEPTVKLPEHLVQAVQGVFGNGPMSLDVALFGRMMAEIPTAKRIEGALDYADALSVHATEPEVDYFIAADTLSQQFEQEAANAMVGNTSFESGTTFYRYLKLETNRLAANLADGYRPEYIGDVIKAILTALPRAGTSRHGNFGSPNYVLVKIGNHTPLNLMGAFERPVEPALAGGIVDTAIQAMLAHEQLIRRKLGSLGRPLETLVLDFTDRHPAFTTTTDLDDLCDRTVQTLKAQVVEVA